ncbi:MAG: hypothetical protein O3C60_04345 [Planctomycetota bacterium]|nr:hypothetical protein [Planctomycetota bacterium]
MLRSVYGSVVLAFAIIVAQQGSLSAYTNGRPLLWPARLVGYGWSDGYHAQPAAQPTSSGRGWWPGRNGGVTGPRYGNPGQWAGPTGWPGPTGYTVPLHTVPGIATPGNPAESLPTPAHPSSPAPSTVGPSALRKFDTRR